MERKKYPIRAEEYLLLEAVGQGVSASVHRARCLPLDEVVAIKILDFERRNSDINSISREAQTMILIDHPNVLKAHCSFVNDHNLWVVMPYMEGGSCLHIMKSAYPNGFEEAVIATILREVLKGLEYLHHHGHIHRDVKAGNILVDGKGGIKMGDFGVSACLFNSGDRQRSRNTFVGTPCWMAPEVMEQLHGYDFKADIWSFGITALELAHGHAPFSKYPPMKVLLMTLQNAPPGLDYERDKKFSRSFKHMIAMCLVKDPSKRPSAQKLLKQPFFKQARSQDYICRKILEGLPTLADRHQAIKDKEEDMVAQKKIPDGKKEEMSQNEYKRGISGWNFDIDDLRSQASLITDIEENLSCRDSTGSLNSLFGFDMMQERILEGASYSASCSSKDDDEMESDGMSIKSPPLLLLLDQNRNSQRIISDKLDHESKSGGQSHHDNPQSRVQSNGNDRENCNNGGCESETDEKNTDTNLDQSPNQKRFLKNCSSSELIHSAHERRFSASSFSHEQKLCTNSCSADNIQSSEGESTKQKSQQQNVGNCNGDVSQTVSEMAPEVMPKPTKSTAPNADDIDDKSKTPVVQQKGRFKVTSEKVDLEKLHPSIGLTKSHSMQCTKLEELQRHYPESLGVGFGNMNLLYSTVKGHLLCHVFSQIPSPNTSSASDSIPNAGSIYHQMHCILQTSILQRDYALSVMKQLSTGEQSAANLSTEGSSSSPSTISLLEASTEREKELIQELTDLQWRVIGKDEEIQRLKTRLAQV